MLRGFPCLPDVHKEFGSVVQEMEMETDEEKKEVAVTNVTSGVFHCP